MDSGSGGGDWPESIPKAQTVSNGGEISCSIDETNRIRIALGLKPLNNNPPQTTSRSTAPDDAVEIGEVSQLSEQVDSNPARRIAEGIAASRARRQEEDRKKKYEDARRALVGDLEEDESVEEDAAAWILRSRKLEREREAAARRSLEEARKSAELSSLKSKKLDVEELRVAHRFDSIQSGEEVVMTLRDSSILTDTGGDLQDEVDELENPLLLEEEKRNWNKKQKEYRGTGYNPLDEYGNENSILSQYDDKNVQFTRESFSLNERHKLGSEDRERKLEQVRARLHASSAALRLGSDKIEGAEVIVDEKDLQGSRIKLKYSLETVSRSEASRDYYTSEEMAQFKKKKKPKKQSRKPLSDFVEENYSNESSVSAPMLSSMDVDTSSLEKSDHGSRKLRQSSNTSQSLDPLDRSSAYERALLREQGKAMEKLRGISVSSVDSTKADIAVDDLGESESKRAAVRERLQRIRIGHLDGDSKLKKGVEDVVLRIRDHPSSANASGSEMKLDDSNVFSSLPLKVSSYENIDDEGLVIDPTAEFVRNLPQVSTFQLRELEKRKKEEEEKKRAESKALLFKSQDELLQSIRESGAAVDEDSLSIIPKQHSASVPLEDMEDVSEETSGKKSEERIEEQEIRPISEPNISSGISAALELFRHRGHLQQLEAGRSKDWRSYKIPNNDEIDSSSSSSKDKKYNFNFSLEYKDEYGLPMKPKEAYRHISYIFHGQKPGKKKQDKYRKNALEIMKQQKTNDQIAAASEKSARGLGKFLSNLQQPFVVVSGSNMQVPGMGVSLDKKEKRRKSSSRKRAAETDASDAPSEKIQSL